MNGLWQILLLFIIGLIVAAGLGLFGGGGLAALIAKILICLILAALLGMILGWLLNSLFGGGWRGKYEELEASFKTKIGGKDRELDGLRAELRAGKGELDKTNLRFADIETERDKHKTAFLDLENQFASFRADLDAERSGRDDLDFELAARTSSIANLGLQLEAKDNEIAGFAAKLKEVESSKARIFELENQIKSFEQANVEKATADKDNVQRIAGFESEIATNRNTISTLEGQVSEKERRIAALEANLSKSKTDTSQQADLSGQMNSLRQDLGSKDKRIVELETELTKVRGSAGKAHEYEAKFNTLRADLSGRDKRILELESDMKAIEAGRQDLDNELSARSSSIADFGLQLDAGKKNLAQKEKRIAELEFELDKAKRAGSKIKSDDGQLAALKADLVKRDQELVKLKGQTNDDNWLYGKISKRYNVQETGIQARYLGEKIRLRGYVSADVHEKLIAKAIKDHGASNIIDELVSTNIVASPNWTESALLGALSVSEDFKDAVYELEDRTVVLTGIVASEKESNNIEAKIRKQLAKELKIDNRLGVLGKDIKTDDLKEIKGVASVLEPVLHSNGVYTFRQIACWTQSDIEQVRESLGGFKGRIEREEWIRQAGELHKKHYDEEPKCYGTRASGFRASSSKSQLQPKPATKKASASSPDDLTRIEGIGPKMNKALIAAGIKTFVQLEAASQEEMRAAINAAGMNFAPSIKTWSKQAKYLVDGDEEGFLKYTDYLIAGRDEGKD